MGGHMDWDLEQDQIPVIIKLTDESTGTKKKGGDCDDEMANAPAPSLATGPVRAKPR